MTSKKTKINYYREKWKRIDKNFKGWIAQILFEVESDKTDKEKLRNILDIIEESSIWFEKTDVYDKEGLEELRAKFIPFRVGDYLQEIRDMKLKINNRI